MRNYSQNINLQITSKSKPNHAKIFILIIVFITISMYLFLKQLWKSGDSITQSTAGETAITTSVSQAITSKTPILTLAKSDMPVLVDKLEGIISGKTGTYSIYYYDIKSGISTGINEKMVITAASVNKIPILAALYYLAGNNTLDLEKIIVPQPSDIQNYGTGSIRYDPTGTPYSIKTLARLMIEKSDNTAAYLLGTHIVGLKKIQNLINDWGLTQTDMYKNSSSVYDQSIILIKMYQKEITTPSLTAEMLGFMDKTDFDDRLPKGVPEGITIYHKTGDEVGKVHDVGIIDLPQRPYYLGVFTTDITDIEDAKKNIALISSAVYDFVSR
ncbi:hypothetical protein A2Y99_00970 [Candidatus Gottesmanbacteria bacterium RBG_13_37_7]|uniref:Beta-lactamase class A catalytic domain-containing protein n=1 Tax=Candidatus Gottesmanbacteria bacterium RBG_13_37_7 TaxID=1798369 RepID=A0A1F5YJS9_9BACT|nr:MAG: hypothetical protein A2Y99_00970 [Candidatus Gottesmanbacteria bacterium RBG_13_37_7]